ncbi:cubilin [Caerostris extrusa]|uniref:Cubilin n=1 Tax=Caerostris extrusa TaxID=172846 RepID=A0AAV4MAL9_CAEEX|nr:cubilin [Caerostris extrusa]
MVTLMFTMTGLCAGCGDYLEGTSGVITSPNYPNALAAVRDCRWRFSAPPGRRVNSPSEFNLPRDESTGICLSYIQTFNELYWSAHPSLDNVEKICGNTLPAALNSSNANFNLDFHTHGLAPGQGFSLTYSTEEESMCGGLLPLPSGSISTPNFTLQNGTYVDCKWRMTGEDQGNQTLVFRFDYVDVPGHMANYCREGVVYLVGKRRLFMGRTCGNRSTEVLLTTPFLSSFVRLIANLGLPMRGLPGTYNVSNCGGVHEGSDAQIMSPGYPIGYPPNSICHWLFIAPLGETITLTVEDFRLEENCDKDSVLVRNGYWTGAPLIGKFCGTHAPAPITSSGRYLTVFFRTDATGSAPGFKMTTREVQRGCGGLIHTTSGNLSSPSYPTSYGNNVECRWVIDYVPGYLVKLEFTGRFDIEMDSTCSKDYVLIEESSGGDRWTEVAKNVDKLIQNRL